MAFVQLKGGGKRGIPAGHCDPLPGNEFFKNGGLFMKPTLIGARSDDPGDSMEDDPPSLPAQAISNVLVKGAEAKAVKGSLGKIDDVVD
jgi:hypothetical protein